MPDKLYTGIDLVLVSRIQDSVEKTPSFLTRFFGEEEQALFTGTGKYKRIAANFAAKEAFSKALGTGIAGFSLREVQVLRDSRGAPFLKLSGKAKALTAGLSFSVSLTHEGEYAAAVVIAVSA